MAKGTDKQVMTYALIIGGGFVLYKLTRGFEGLLEALGLKDSASTQALDDATGSSTSFWNPSFYKTAPAGAVILTDAAASQLCNLIYGAFGMFNDDEEQAIGAVKTLKTQAQVSYLAEKFYSIYHQDLLTFLRGGSYPQDRLSDSDVYALTSYIQSLPKYFL